MRYRTVRRRSDARGGFRGLIGGSLSALLGRTSGQGHPDFVLVAVILILVTLGIDMVYSASFIVAHNSPQYQSDTYFLVRQLMWAGLGLVGMVLASRIDYHFWRRVSVPLMVVVVIMMAAVLVKDLGHSAYGAQRWLSLGPLPPIQPSEFAKLALVVYLAHWLSSMPGRAPSLTKGAIPFAIIVATVGGLALAQRDLGSAFIIVMAGAALFFIGGADLRHFAVGMVMGTVALATSVLLTGYRFDRIEAFKDPSQDPLGFGWQAIQTNIALGSGGILGLGLGASRQKAYWLPAAHTDNIFAVIGEELGLFGTVLVVALFLLLSYRGLKAMMAAPDAFGRLLAGGITIWIVMQAVVNMAAVVSLIPFTGIPLPFLSSGGSSMVVTLGAMGILLNISRYERNLQPGAGRTWGAVVGRSS